VSWGASWGELGRSEAFDGQRASAHLGGSRARAKGGAKKTRNWPHQRMWDGSLKERLVVSTFLAKKE